MITIARNLLAVLRHAIRPTVGETHAPPAAIHYAGRTEHEVLATGPGGAGSEDFDAKLERWR